MECKYNQDEFCTNDQCPMCADYCPVPDYEGVCKYEDREEAYVPTPKACLMSAMISAEAPITCEDFELIWSDFVCLMKRYGYVQEDDYGTSE